MTDRELAARELSYATSLTIQLLAELDKTRAQLSIMREEDDGHILVCPTGCLALDATLARVAKACREIKRAGER